MTRRLFYFFFIKSPLSFFSHWNFGFANFLLIFAFYFPVYYTHPPGSPAATEKFSYPGALYYEAHKDFPNPRTWEIGITASRPTAYEAWIYSVTPSRGIGFALLPFASFSLLCFAFYDFLLHLGNGLCPSFFPLRVLRVAYTANINRVRQMKKRKIYDLFSSPFYPFLFFFFFLLFGIHFFSYWLKPSHKPVSGKTIGL